MKIIKLRVNNFRQFYSEQEIYFSTDNEKNITIIHGENGTGKTALINAFKWCFYGKTDFDNYKEEDLVNEVSLKLSSEVVVFVECEFIYSNSTYVVKRSMTKNSNNKYENKFQFSKIESNGEYIQQKTGNSDINRMLPEELHSYFFFNGERIDKLASAEATNDISNAIRNVMGLVIIDRALDHLKKVLSFFNSERKKLGNENITSLENDREKINRKISDKEHIKEQKKFTITQLEKENIQLSQLITSNKDAAYLQEKQKKYIADMKEKEEDLKGLRNDMKLLISSIGYFAFSEEMLNSVSSIIGDKRKKGELPSKIKEQFVIDILDSHKCICGRDLIEGDEYYNNVLRFKENAYSNSLEAQFNAISTMIPNMQREQKRVFDEISKKINDEREMISKIEKLRNEINEISVKLKGFNGNIGAWEEKKETNKAKIDELNINIGALEQDIKQKKEKEDEINKCVEDATINNAEGQMLQNKIDFTKQLIQLYQKFNEALINEVRKKLSEKVNETFTNIISKKFRAEISDDFKLQIFDEHGVSKTNKKSTGENQVASLAFIASLIDHCKSGKNRLISTEAFPMVMDSPFGSLDVHHRRMVSKWIPVMAEQIVIMVSDTQYSEEVSSEVKDKIGKEYNLMFYSPTQKEGINKKYYLPHEKYEFCRMEEVDV